MDQLQPPPESYKRHDGGSVGPVIAVLAVIAILGVIAGMIGRLCSGRRVFGYGDYDLEGWLETKFSACIDGRVDPNTNTRRFMVDHTHRTRDDHDDEEQEVTVRIAVAQEKLQHQNSHENTTTSSNGNRNIPSQS